MGSIYKWALFCFFLFLTQYGYNQCLTSRPITTTKGDTVVYLCPGGTKSDVSVKQFTYGMPFASVVTNTQNIALLIASSSVIDLAVLPEGEYRIYSYSYKGFLNNIIGKNIFEHQLTSYCYTRSSNFIRVIKIPPAAPVIDAQSFNPLYICGPDQKFDSLRVNAQFPTGNSRAFIVVNEINKIVMISSIPLINADPLECKICKVYAAGYSGNLIAKKGDDLSVALADDCYSISKNFITLNHELPSGGTISMNGDATNQFICADSKKDQLIPMSIIGNKGGLVRYIITDSSDIILDIKNEPILSSASLRAGVCKVHGLTYTGNINPNLIGKKITSAVLSDDCYALTSNSVLIIKKRPFAGELVVNKNETKFCLNDSSSELVIERKNTISGAQKWIITNENGIIEQIIDTKLIPGRWSRGEKRVYNLSYTGIFLLKPGSLISDQASDDCFDLSKGFISILVDNPNPGNLAFIQSARSLFVCAIDTPSLKIQFYQSGNNSFKQQFVLTTEVGTILSTLDSNKIDMTRVNNGSYRVYAISFNGALKYNVGDLFSSIKSDKCLSVGNEYLSITKGEAKAGIVEFEHQRDSLLVCLDTEIRKFRLKNTASSVGKVRYIITSSTDTVVSIQSDSIDLKGYTKGVYKIRTLAYTDTFNITPGSLLSSLKNDRGCIDLAENPLTVIIDKAESGNIYLNEKDTSYQICAKDGWPDLLRLKNTSASKFPYTYVLTDTSNTILVLQAAHINFEQLPTYNVRVYGVSYSGSILAKVGDQLDTVSFSTSCASISKKYLPVSGCEILAGTIRTSTNVSQLFYCLDSKYVDTIRLSNNGSALNSRYLYIGVQRDTLRFVSNTGILLSTELPAGISQIFGLAYSGNFEGIPGDKVSTKRLVDSCFGVSSNSITVNKEHPKAGLIKAGSDDKIFLCPGDGQSDHISFTSIESSALSYAYLIVNETDTIIDVSTSSLIDFDPYPKGICRVYGISYKGTLHATKKKLNATDLAEDCFDITKNFVSVIKSDANAGRLSLKNGDTSVQFCVEDLSVDTLRFKSSSSANLNYTLLVTNTQDRIVFVLDDLNKLYDFNGYDPGLYRVYGLSFGGLLTAGRNDQVKIASLASGCYDLSDNFISLDLTSSGGLCKNIGVNKENFAFISIFPNPVQGSFRVRLKPTMLKSGKPELSLVSASGGNNTKIILSSQVTVNEDIEIDVRNLTPGMYFLLFKNGYIFDRIKVMIIR